MVEITITKVDKENLIINGTRVNVKEYNEEFDPGWFHFRKASYGNIPGVDSFITEAKEAQKYFGWLHGSLEGEYKDGKFISMPGSGKWVGVEKQLQETAKNKKLAASLYADYKKKIALNHEKRELLWPNKKGFLMLSPAHIKNFDVADSKGQTGKDRLKIAIENNNQLWRDNLEIWKEAISLARQLNVQRNETGQKPGEDYVPIEEPDNREERNQKWAEINELKENFSQEIDAALSISPSVDSSELNKPNWKDLLGYARSKTEIENLKKEILNDISTKRATKQGKRKRDNEENDNSNDNPNKKPRGDSETEKDGWNSLKNSTLESVEDNEIVAGLKIATRLEGEEEYKDEESVKKGEEELSKRNEPLYKQTIIEALKERIDDNEISLTNLSVETQQLINGEITEISQFKEVKERAIKEIGEEGAKSKWTSLFDKAKSLLRKAKNKVTRQIKEDIQSIQKQMSSLKTKAGTNSYLNSVYKQNKDEVERLEKDLSSYATDQQTGEPKGTPWGIIIPVSLVVISLIGIVAVVMIRRKRKPDKVRTMVE